MVIGGKNFLNGGSGHGNISVHVRHERFSRLGETPEVSGPPREHPQATGQYSSRYVGRKGEEYFRYQSGMAEAAASLIIPKIEHLVSPDDDLLDFGCGSGEFLSRLPGRSKVGVDINEAAVAEARRRGFEVYRSLAEIPAERQFDVALSNHCLEHVPYPIAALREIRQRLRSGGWLILCLPIDDWRYQRHYDPEDINHHLHTWTPLLLGHTLTEAGFEVGSMRIVTQAWPRRLARWQARLPTALWDFLCFIGGVIRKRRSLLTVANKPAGEKE